MDAMTCCDAQSPRISERTGRLFCANCRTFLDNGSVRLEPRRDEMTEETNANTSSAPATLSMWGDGDPNYPGGIGCEYDDTLWATATSWARHMLEAHNEVYEDLNSEFDQEGVAR